MQWQKITLPLMTDQVDPQVVKIGDLAREVYLSENKPAGFAMFHAARASEGKFNDTFLIYLSPVAAELCSEIRENYTLEPCGVPARNEPDIAFVFGDPLMMGQLQDQWAPSPEEAQWQVYAQEKWSRPSSDEGQDAPPPEDALSAPSA